MIVWISNARELNSSSLLISSKPIEDVFLSSMKNFRNYAMIFLNTISYHEKCLCPIVLLTVQIDSDGSSILNVIALDLYVADDCMY